MNGRGDRRALDHASPLAPVQIHATREGRWLRPAALALILPLALAACAKPSSQTYEARDVGRTIETSEASVVSSRVVKITGETNAIGPAAGGIGAAATTGAFVNGRNAGLLAVLAGLVGAGAGYAAQKQLNDREGIEYILRMDDGRTVTLVQNREGEEEPIADGAPVLVQLSGGYTRIIPDPTTDAGAGALPKPGDEDWIDPDQTGAAAPGEELPAPAGGPAAQQQ
jgi:outer membrane lipoprotein SlyB